MSGHLINSPVPSVVVGADFQVNLSLDRVENIMKYSINLSTAAALAAASILVAAAAAPHTYASTRPIQDFVSTQGTFCIDDGSGGCLLFVPPVPNFVGWTVSGETIVASVDYAGLANGAFPCGTANFGTQTEGTVLERPLRDGRAEVTVVLHTTNALTWVADSDFATGPLLFGHRVCNVLAGADAALSDSQLQVVFINSAPAPAPLPDLLQLLFAPEPGQELISIYFNARATGTLRAAFGVPDGTPGRATVVQTGTLFRTHFGGATADGFPAERIDLRIVGRIPPPHLPVAPVLRD